MPKTPLSWTTKTCRLGDLIEWDKNPVKISDKDAKELARSLDKFEHVLPYVAAAPFNGKKGLPLLDGHQRKTVELNLLKVPPETKVDVRVPSRPLTEKERKELAIRLRKNTGEFDFDKLIGNFDVTDLMDWGFTEKELQAGGFEITDDSKDAAPQLDRAEELLKIWKVKTGDLWAVGEHKLLCGDSTKREDVERVMGGEKAEITFTSPPYWVGKDYEYQKSLQEVKDFIKAICENMTLVTNTDGGRIIINTSTASARAINKKADAETLFTLAWYQDVFRNLNWLMRHCRVWIKNGGMGAPRVAASSDVIDQHWEVIPEFLPTFYYPEGLRRGQEKIGMKWAQLGVWSDIKGDMSSEGHIAAFPLELPRRYVLLYTKEGEIVYEPFGGSGTTMVACNNLGRKCRMIEIDPKYVSVALQRMQDAFPGIKIEKIKS